MATKVRREARLDDLARLMSARIDALRGENAFKSFADAMPGVIWTADRSGRTSFISRRWYDVFDTPDMDWLAIIHPDDHDAAVAAWMHSVSTGEPYHRTARFRDAHGKYQLLVSRAHPARTPDGSIAYWVGTSSVLDAVAVTLLQAA